MTKELKKVAYMIGYNNSIKEAKHIKYKDEYEEDTNPILYAFYKQGNNDEFFNQEFFLPDDTNAKSLEVLFEEAFLKLNDDKILAEYAEEQELKKLSPLEYIARICNVSVEELKSVD